MESSFSHRQVKLDASVGGIKGLADASLVKTLALHPARRKALRETSSGRATKPSWVTRRTAAARSSACHGRRASTASTWIPWGLPLVRTPPFQVSIDSDISWPSLSPTPVHTGLWYRTCCGVVWVQSASPGGEEGVVEGGQARLAVGGLLASRQDRQRGRGRRGIRVAAGTWFVQRVSNAEVCLGRPWHFNRPSDHGRQEAMISHCLTFAQASAEW